MQIEHITRISFAARWATQQQRNLTIGPSLFGQVIINDQRVLTAVTIVFADGTASEGGQVLHSGRIGGGSGNNDGVIHGAVLFEFAHYSGNRRRFLTHSDVDTFNARVFLVDDGIYGDGRFTDLSVTDNQLTLPATEDRKSTRLNSSHVAISYAVFCLKKKRLTHVKNTGSI